MNLLAVQAQFGGEQFGGNFSEPSFSTDFFNNPLWTLLISLALLGLILFLGLLFIRKFFWRTASLRASLGMKILLISTPKEALKKDNADEAGQIIQEEIGVAENIFAVMGGLRAQKGLKHWLFGRTDHFSAEIMAREGKIYFYLAVPEDL